MFEENGIIYASDAAPEIQVTGARSVGSACLIVMFDTGKERLLDTAELLYMPAFEPLSDPDIAEAAYVDHGMLMWLNGTIDLAPKATYCMSHEYVDPIRMG